MMIPGFEDQLIGKQVGDEVTVEVTFPEAYGNQALAGKAASFAVEIKEIGEPQPRRDRRRSGQGPGLRRPRGAEGPSLREGMEREYARISRLRVKRALLDHLAETCRFEVPAGMVELEFDAIWQQLKREMAAGQGDGERGRRARRDGQGGVPRHRRAARAARPDPVRRRPGQRVSGSSSPSSMPRCSIRRGAIRARSRRCSTSSRTRPQALEQLRAPLYEDKVVDFILQLASVTDQPMTPEELMKDPDDEADAAAGPPAEAAGADASEPSASREQA